MRKNCTFQKLYKTATILTSHLYLFSNVLSTAIGDVMRLSEKLLNQSLIKDIIWRINKIIIHFINKLFLIREILKVSSS